MKQTKQIVSAVLVLSMLLGCVVAFSVTAFAANGVALPDGAEAYDGTPTSQDKGLEGAGTEANPFKIANAADFVYFLTTVCKETEADGTTNTAEKYYKLTGDVYLNAQDSGKSSYSLPSMSASNGYRNFAGVLDGDGHTVYNPYANYNVNMAMFYMVTGEIKNMTIAGAYFNNTGTSGGNSSAAVLTYKLTGGIVRNVHFTDTYVACGSNGPIVGAVASYSASNAVIEGCTVSGVMKYSAATSARMQIGGFVGNANTTVIRNCVNNASVIGFGTETSAGGIVGNAAGTTVLIEMCENHGTVTVNSEYVNSSTGASTYSTSSRAGGIVGKLEASELTLKDCRNTAPVTGYTQVGGLIGFVHTSSPALKPVIASCVNEGNVTATTNYAGGIFGRVQDTKGGLATVIDTANYGNISAENDVGGFVGGAGNGNGGWASTKYTFVNSATYGNVSATAENAGLAFGNHVQQNVTRAVELINCVLIGSVTAVNNAGAIYGSMSSVASKYSSQSLSIQKSYVKSDVTVAADGVAATLIGGSTDTYITALTLDTTDSRFAVTVTVGDAVQDTPVSYYLAGVAQSVTLPAMSATALTDRTAVTALSTYAEENGYSYWQQAETVPELAIFFDGAVNITNASSLSHAYTGAPLNVTYDMKETVASVDVKWYSTSDLTTPLTAIPTDAGTYRVVLTAYDAENNVLGGGNTFYRNFTIVKAATEITLDLSGYTDDGDGTYSIQYDSAGAQIPATTVNVATGTAFAGTVVTEVTQEEAAATALMPGTYLFTFTYEGDANHEATTKTLTLDILKKQITYPENIWKNQAGETVSEGYAPVYTGSEQSVTVNADSSIYEINLGGTYAATDATAESMTATATVTLKADLTDRYEISGEAPTYTLTWSIARAPVYFAVVDGEGNPADLTNLTYQTDTRTFYVIVADAAGNQVATPTDNTIVVTNAGTYSKTVSYAGSENYLPIAAREYSFTVSPVKMSATHADIVKIYDGTPVIFTPNFGTAPEGCTWDTAVAYVILKWNAETSAYDISVTDAVNGGKYFATFSCKTTNGNYVSEGSVEFTIAQKAPTFTPNTDGWESVEGGYAVDYDSNEHAFLVTSDSDGAITVTYSTDGETYVATAPKNAAVYTVKAVVAATENYTEKTETYQVTVRKFVITVPEDANLWNYTGAFTYDGETHTVALSQAFLDTYGQYLLYPYSGNYAEVNANAADAAYRATVTIQLKDPDNYEFAGGSTADVVKNLDWKIQPMALDFSGIVFADAEKVYNGEEQSITATIPAALLELLNVEYSAGGTNASTTPYVITLILTLKPENIVNYTIPANNTLTANLTIVKNTVTISASDKTVTYNGENQSVTATAVGQEGTDFGGNLTVTVTKGGEPIQPDAMKNAGVYSVTFALDNDNLIATPVTVTLTVNRARYAWNENSVTVVGDTTFISDGKPHSVTLQVNLTGADGAVTVDESRLPAIPTTPGTYILTYYLVGTDNYEPLDPYTVTLTVLKPSISDADRGVEVVFPDGAAADLAVNVAEKETDKALKNALKDADTVKHAAIETLYTYSFVNGEGKTVSLAELGKVMVSMTLPEQYRNYESIDALLEDLSFVSVSYASGEPGVTVIQKSDLIYDAETGTVSFPISDASAAYGYATQKNMAPVYIAIILGAVSLVAIIGVSVLMVSKKKASAAAPAGDTTDTGSDKEN